MTRELIASWSIILGLLLGISHETLAAALESQYTYTTLDFLPGIPAAINKNGDIVGTARDIVDPTQGFFGPYGFLYSGGEIFTFTISGAEFGMNVTGINDWGDIVGGYCSPTLSTQRVLPPAEGGGIVNSCAGFRTTVAAVKRAVASASVLPASLDCSVVVSPNAPFTLDCVSFIFPGRDTYIIAPTKINNNGDIVGWLEQPPDANDEGFVIGGGGASPFGTDATIFAAPGSGPNSIEGTYPTGVNDAGQIVGLVGDKPFVFLRNPPNAPTEFADSIPTPPTDLHDVIVDGQYGAIDNTGRIFGQYTFETEVVTGVFTRKQFAFVLGGNDFTPLLPLGNPAAIFLGVSSIGEVVGGIRGSQENIGFRATPTVGALPRIDNISPASGPRGTPVTIAGENFGATQGTSTVTFGSTPATVTLWSDTQIDVTVPSLPAGSYDVVVTTSAGSSNPFSFTVECGVYVVRWGQCAGKDDAHKTAYAPFPAMPSEMDGHWGAEPYAFHPPTGAKICTYGCGTTVLAMALVAAKVSPIPTDNIQALDLQEFADTVNTEPGHLNDYMTSDPASLDYTFDNDVNFPVVVRHIREQLKLRAQLGLPGGVDKSISFIGPSGPPLQGNVPINGSNQPAHDFLDQTLCAGFPVIVKVRSKNPSPNPSLSCNLGPGGVRRPVQTSGGSHFVLVTGQKDNDYTIADPAGLCVDGPELPRFKLLSAYGNQDPNQYDFEIRGYVKDPPGDASMLNLSLGDNASLLVADDVGRRTGFNVATKANLYEIPDSSFFEDAIGDDENGGPATGTSRIVNINQPKRGVYRITVIGLQQGPYALGVSAFSTDGTAQPVMAISGTTQAGLTSVVELKFDPSPGAVLHLVGDLNGDGKVDCSDVAIVKASFGKRKGQSGFDSRADTNNDGIVNVKDLAFVTQKLPAGTRCP